MPRNKLGYSFKFVFVGDLRGFKMKFDFVVFSLRRSAKLDLMAEK